MDLNMPGLGGIEATRQICQTQPTCAVLVLTMVADDDSVFAAVRAGARGYLLKGADEDELLRAIRAVAEGVSSVVDAAGFVGPHRDLDAV